MESNALAADARLIYLTREPIDVPKLLEAARRDSDGAVASFIGVVRNHADGRGVLRLEYHAFEPMAQRVLEQIGEEIRKRWDARAVIVHRLGLLEIGEASVAIAVGSAHRDAAFTACRYAIEQIKHDVPIWKKEHYAGEATWIEPQPAP